MYTLSIYLRCRINSSGDYHTVLFLLKFEISFNKLFFGGSNSSQVIPKVLYVYRLPKKIWR